MLSDEQLAVIAILPNPIECKMLAHIAAQAEALATWRTAAIWLWQHANGFHFSPEKDGQMAEYDERLDELAEMLTAAAKEASDATE